MDMPVMDVREMIMVVLLRRVMMGMGMRFPSVPRKIVVVLMVFVVDVLVGMIQCLMHVPVLMGLGQMKPYANAHQNGRDPERRGVGPSRAMLTAAPTKGAVEK
jgi:hypothetical protein